MSRTRKNTMTKKPPRPLIPNDARIEILSVLSSDMRINTNEVEAILYKHGVAQDPETLQRSYRLAAGQRLMASLRDDEGKREVLAVPSENGGTEYIVVDACNDERKLKAARHRLHQSIVGLENTSGKLKARLGFLKRLSGFIHIKEKKEESQHKHLGRRQDA